MSNPMKYLTALVMLLLGSLSFATTYRALSLEEMTQRAELAFYGTVTDIQVEEREGEPWTVVTFAVSEALIELVTEEGDTAPAESVELAFYGGTLPSGQTLNVEGMPRFQPGDEVIVLAYKAPYYSPIVGFSQGLWTLTERGFVDPQGRLLSLDEAGALQRDGAGAGTEALLAALGELLEGTP